MSTQTNFPLDSVLDNAALERLRDLDPGGERGLLGRVFNAFRSSSAALLAQLHAARQRRDASGIRHVAHTLKSSAAIIGAIKLSTLCAEIESMIGLGQFDAAQSRTDELEGELSLVLQALAPPTTAAAARAGTADTQSMQEPQPQCETDPQQQPRSGR